MRNTFLGKALVRCLLPLLGSLMIATSGTASAADNYMQTIKDRGEIRVGILVDWPPYDGVDADNKPAGYDADVAKLLADYLGLKLKLVVMTGPNRVPFLLTDKADVLVASLAITPERQKQVQFSQPYSAASMVLLGPDSVHISSPQDFLKYKIGVPRASTTDLGVSKVAPKGTNLRRFDDDASALQAMLVGQIDAVGTSSVIAANVQKRYPGKYKVLYVVNEQQMAIAMQKNRPELLKTMNGFIAANIKNGKLSAAFQKWLGTPLPASVVDAGK
ncbi:MAG TPA: transporter substrate-binding domain-containing protein [Burkholderiaceae bacterium]|nr:transporter substrate-binding domain-containing protein [Burkholderiaceae bacterium]